MADKRPYAKYDVGYLDNPKIQALMDDHPRAILLHQACINYGVQHATDGVVPVRIALRKVCGTQCDLDLLLGNGMLSDIGDGNVLVHDFLEHQRSSDAVKTRSQAASLAASARWDAERKAGRNANRTAKGKANRNAEKERDITTSSSEIASDPDDASLRSIDATPRPEVVELCDYLAAKVRDNGHPVGTVGKVWHRACRLLIDRDGHTPDQIRKAIDWCTADPFWSANIRSMPTLREKYSTLRAQAAQRPASSTPPAPKEPRYVPSYHDDADDLDAYKRWYAIDHNDPAQVSEYRTWYAARHLEAS